MIKLTEDAANAILQQIKESGCEDPLRIAVTKHQNTKGFQYLMGFDKKNDDDSLYEIREVKIIIKNDQLDAMNNMEIDFVEIDGENDKQFIFKNPNDPNYKPPTE
jgi:iron-sulfur cluster assembly accessory protein